MQVVFYETTNIVKYQYFDIGALNGNSATIGLRFAKGSPAPNDFIQYAHDTPGSIADGRAIVFYPSDNLNATSSLDITTVAQGTQNQAFTLSVANVQLNGSSFLQNMGKADVVRLGKPSLWATTEMSVNQVVVDGENFFLLNSSNPPTANQSLFLGNVATWYYNSTNDSLYVVSTFCNKRLCTCWFSN